MIHFSTDDIAPEDRFDQWREVRGKNLFGVTIELPAERRHAFRGSFRAHFVGNAVASQMQASAYSISRTGADIARIAGDSLCIAFQVKGSGRLEAGGDRSHAVSDGDMTISYSDLPYLATPGKHDEFHYRMLKIPVADELMLGRPAHDLFATRYSHNTAFSRPFKALFDALSTKPGRLVDAQREVANIARLAMVARGRLQPGMPEVRAAVRSGLRFAAEDIMVRDKHRQKLTPATVAYELGISVRQLHVVFASAELTFSRTLAMMRIEEARKLLVDFPSLPVIQIAYACGFDNLATFYRLFNNACGMPPGEFRERGLLH